MTNGASAEPKRVSNELLNLNLIISITIYIGIKVIVGRRKKMIAKSVGDGICVQCGEKITNKKCPNCDVK